MAEVENIISQDALEISNVQTRVERLDKIMEGLDGEIAAKNEIINRSDAEIVKRNAIIERKQNIIDQYNKKLEVLISSAGVSGFFPYLSVLRENNSQQRLMANSPDDMTQPKQYLFMHKKLFQNPCKLPLL